MKRLLAHVVIGALMLSAGALAQACNDSADTVTLEEYFSAIDKLDQESSEKSAALSQQMEALDDADVEQALELENGQADALEAYADDAGDLNPPDEVAEAHNTAVEDIRESLSSRKAFLKDRPRPATVSDLFASYEGFDFSEVEAAADSCRQLESIAADNNIEVDLDCGEEG